MFKNGRMGIKENIDSAGERYGSTVRTPKNADLPVILALVGNETIQIHPSIGLPTFFWMPTIHIWSTNVEWTTSFGQAAGHNVYSSASNVLGPNLASFILKYLANNDK